MKFPRFKLRTLFLLVAAFAAASWVYFIGWPWWTMYREECHFENEVKQLHDGIAWNNYLHGSYLKSPHRQIDLNFNMIGKGDGQMMFTTREWPNAIYFIFIDFNNGVINLYRIPPAPGGYVPQSEKGKAAYAGLKGNTEIGYTESEKKSVAYQIDFANFMSGDLKASPDFKYELIHSLSLPKPESKPSD